MASSQEITVREVRPEVLALDRMVDIGAGRNHRMLLDKNERTSPFESDHLQNILSSITDQDLNRYPDQSELYEKLAGFLKIDSQNLLLTVGSDSSLKHVFETFVECGNRVVSIRPSYAMINVYAHMFGADLVTVGYNENLELCEDALLKNIDSRTKLVVLPNPNQPTGTILRPAFVQELLRATEDQGVLLLIDEAYIEFSDQPSLISEISRFDNLLVLRTLSKAWGLAGVRLGYIAAEVSAIDQLRKVKSLLDINIIAIKAACYFLDRYSVIEEFVNEVKDGRELLRTELGKLNVEIISSSANFIHARLPNGISPEVVEDSLLTRGIKVRVAGGTASVLDGCIRMTIGTRDQIKQLVKELSSVMDVLDS